MSIYEFKNRLILIKDFIIKMNNETIPASIQRIFIKIYANDLKLNLTDRMLDDII
jgi:hypothetical protein